MNVQLKIGEHDIEAALAYARWKHQTEFRSWLDAQAPVALREKRTPICLNTRGKRIYEMVLRQIKAEKTSGVMLKSGETKAVVQRLHGLRTGRATSARAPTKLITRASLKLTSVQKFVGGGKRTIRGLATSASLDRVGDVVEPRGGKWNLPVPMLWMHKHDQPVGWVRSATITHQGIEIEAEIAEGVGKADEIWRMVEAGLVDSFSIGFQADSWEPLPNGGKRFTSWTLLEVSIVTIPANPDAKIRRGMEQAGRGIPLVSARRSR